MSFILDALRKSESERQRGSVPGLAHVPSAVARPGLPRWAIAVMVLLGASAAVMAAAWWIAIDSDAERAALVAMPLELDQPRHASPSLPPTLARRAGTSLRSAAAVPSAAAPESAPRVPSPTPPAAAETAAVSSAPLPSVAEVEAQGTDVPDLRLELHVYADAPAGRYVFVNGKMYREGETLDDGPRLLRIDPRGAVLRHQGRDFLLAQ